VESGKGQPPPGLHNAKRRGIFWGVRRKWKRKPSLRGFGPTTTKGRQTIINRDGKNSVVPALLIRLILSGSPESIIY